MKEKIKNLEMVDFSISESEHCKADTGQSVVKQISRLVALAEQRDNQTGAEYIYGSAHPLTVY